MKKLLSRLSDCRGAAEAIHDGDAEAGFTDWLGDDCVQARFVELAHDKKQAYRGFGDVASYAMGLDYLRYWEEHAA